MNLVKLEKVTLNIGSGEGGERLDKARALLEKLSGRKAVLTLARTRNPTFHLRKGQPIGVKVTLRGIQAKEFLKRALESVDNVLNQKKFFNGGFAFGVREYIDFPGVKYDPKIGMFGFDVCVTLTKPGARVARRRIAPKRLPRKQRVSQQEALEFAKSFGVKIEEE
ncbi:MAG: 50S ribosomal protein L5 [Candidatus Micrarchaeota archaeon]